MIYRIADSDFKQMVSRSISPAYARQMQPGDTVQALHDTKVGSFTMGQTYFPNATIVDLQANLNNTVRLQGVTDPSHISMHFHLQGCSTARIEGFHKSIPFTGAHHNIFYCHNPVGSFEFPVQQHFRYFVVSLHPDFIYSRIDTGEKVLEKMMEKIVKGESYLVAKQHLPLLPHMKTVIEDIRNCHFTGAIKQLYLESKILELFSWQLYHCKVESATLLKETLSPEDRKIFYELKAYLEGHFLEPHSLSSIAKTFGLNEFKLKKGFKELFSYTVFGYLLELRLQHARLLLEEKLINIHEAAAQIGYSSAAHFSTAFKKRFGICPGKLRKCRDY